MNKLSKILLLVVVVLIVALSIMTFSYFKVKKVAKENLNLYLNSEKKITLLIQNHPELQNIDFEALENQENQQ